MSSLCDCSNANNCCNSNNTGLTYSNKVALSGNISTCNSSSSSCQAMTTSSNPNFPFQSTTVNGQTVNNYCYQPQDSSGNNPPYICTTQEGVYNECWACRSAIYGGYDINIGSSSDYSERGVILFENIGGNTDISSDNGYWPDGYINNWGRIAELYGNVGFGLCGDITYVKTDTITGELYYTNATNIIEAEQGQFYVSKLAADIYSKKANDSSIPPYVGDYGVRFDQNQLGSPLGNETIYRMSTSYSSSPYQQFQMYAQPVDNNGNALFPGAFWPKETSPDMLSNYSGIAAVFVPPHMAIVSFSYLNSVGTIISVSISDPDDFITYWDTDKITPSSTNQTYFTGLISNLSPNNIFTQMSTKYSTDSGGHYDVNANSIMSINTIVLTDLSFLAVPNNLNKYNFIPEVLLAQNITSSSVNDPGSVFGTDPNGNSYVGLSYNQNFESFTNKFIGRSQQNVRMGDSSQRYKRKDLPDLKYSIPGLEYVAKNRNILSKFYNNLKDNIKLPRFFNKENLTSYNKYDYAIQYVTMNPNIGVFSVEWLCLLYACGEFFDSKVADFATLYFCPRSDPSNTSAITPPTEYAGNKPYLNVDYFMGTYCKNKCSQTSVFQKNLNIVASCLNENNLDCQCINQTGTGGNNYCPTKYWAPCANNMYTNPNPGGAYVTSSIDTSNTNCSCDSQTECTTVICENNADQYQELSKGGYNMSLFSTCNPNSTFITAKDIIGIFLLILLLIFVIIAIVLVIRHYRKKKKQNENK